MHSRTVGIISGKGGVGKTTTVVNLSAALNQMSKKVIAVDADIKMSGLGLQLGMYHFPTTLNDALGDHEKLYHAMYIHPSGLRIIPASISLKDCDISRLKDILNSPLLKNNMVLVDGPPGLEENALIVMKACESLLIVTEPELPAITDVMKIIELSNDMGVKITGLIINKYRKDKNQISKHEIEATCHVPVIGVIPEDKNIKKSIFKREPVVISRPYSPASIAYKQTASKLIGIEYQKDNIFKRILGRVLP